MKAIIYTRFSPRPDEATTRSDEAQLTVCRRHCAAKGYEIVHEDEDRNRSGDDEARPGLHRCIESLRRGWVLVVAEPERLARGAYFEEFLYRIVESKGARIEAVTGGMNGTTDEEVLIRRILAANREYQKKITARWTKARMLTHQANGYLMSKHPPFGWRESKPTKKTDRSGETVIQRRIVPDESEQATIARIASWAAEGRSTGWIAKRLNSIGEPCRGKAWHRETVRRILARTS